jgi:hypothetical protein
LIDKRRGSLRALEADIAQPAERRVPGAAAGWWKGHATLRQECDKLLAECLAYALGPLTRGLRWWEGEALDGGLCAVADDLLEQLTVPADQLWSRRTVLSDSEFMGEPAQIIRLRFPVRGIWDLPVAAHEFGHLLGLGPRFRTSLESLTQRAQERSWLHEHFADVFATYVLGPAFACTCLLTRFDPTGDPNRSWETHPSDDLRARAILWTLDEMERTVADHARAMTSIAALLSTTWRDCLSAAAPRQGSIEQPQRDRLKRWFDELFALIDVNCSQAKYDRWPRAKELAHKIRPGARPPRQEDLSDTSVRDLVNAAWHARTALHEAPYEVEQVSLNAISWCRKLIEHGGK